MVCGLVDRLRVTGYEHALVDFRTESVKVLEREVHREKFEPKSKEKGQVRVVEVSSGNGTDYRISHSSDLFYLSDVPETRVRSWGVQSTSNLFHNATTRFQDVDTL